MRANCHPSVAPEEGNPAATVVTPVPLVYPVPPYSTDTPVMAPPDIVVIVRIALPSPPETKTCPPTTYPLPPDTIPVIVVMTPLVTV